MKNLEAKLCAFGLKTNYDLKFVRMLLNFHTKISMKKWFLPIFNLIFQDLGHFTQLWKITPFLYNNFSGLVRSSLSPWGRPCTMYIKINFYLSTVIIVIEYEARTSVENRQPRNILQNKLDFVSKLIETFPSDNKDRPSPINPAIMSLKKMRQHSKIVSNKYK